MIRPHRPLNGLRAFEAAARHLSFTRAAVELCVTPAALGHQVKALEERLGVALFHRLPRGVALTDEGQALLPVLREAFDRMAGALDDLRGGRGREVLSVGAVGTFAVGWLLPRLAAFAAAWPAVDVRLSTNNNRVDIAEEGLDFAIRYGDGAWHGTDAVKLFDAPLSPLCAPAMAARLRERAELSGEVLLRSYRVGEWSAWFEAAGAPGVPLTGPVFDSAQLMVQAAMDGHGVALAPPLLFEREVREGRLARPFAEEAVLGGYWLTSLKSRRPSAGMTAFAEWIVEQALLPWGEKVARRAG